MGLWHDLWLCFGRWVNSKYTPYKIRSRLLQLEVSFLCQSQFSISAAPADLKQLQNVTYSQTSRVFVDKARSLPYRVVPEMFSNWFGSGLAYMTLKTIVLSIKELRIMTLGTTALSSMTHSIDVT